MSYFPNTQDALLHNQFSATATLSGESTVIPVSVPTHAKMISVQLRVDELIVSPDGGNLWGAVFSGGSTTVIAIDQEFAKNTKVDKILTGEIVDAVVNIVVECRSRGGGAHPHFSGGVVRAIVCYEEVIPMCDV